MVDNVEITSKEMIKPSSPTPHHLRTLQLSFLDQFAPSFYISLILFYQAADQLHSQILKKSLCNVLTQFYPLGGRLSVKNSSIDCNDSGALYVEAKIHAHLEQVIKDASMEEMEQYLPLGPNGEDCSLTEDNTILAAVQINVFECGGIAVAVQMSHKIADANSLVNFMNAWAATCRGDDDDDVEKFSPRFDMANLFPPIDISTFGSGQFTDLISKEKIVARRFVFDKETIAKLKVEAECSVPDPLPSPPVNAECSAPDPLPGPPGLQVMKKNPTRVEVISAFLWKKFIDISEAKNSKKTVTVTHIVNLRPRMDPSIPDQGFGNIWITSPPAVPSINLVDDLSNMLRKIDGDYVKKIQNVDDYLNYVMEIIAPISKGETEMCIFSSWCRFPVYEVDYGWGKPVWVCPCSFPFANSAVFMRTNCGEGIEAWIRILQEDGFMNF